MLRDFSICGFVMRVQALLARTYLDECVAIAGVLWLTELTSIECALFFAVVAQCFRLATAPEMTP